MKDPRTVLADGLEDRANRLEEFADEPEKNVTYRAHITVGLFLVTPVSIILGILTYPDVLGIVAIVAGIAYLVMMLTVYPDVREARREAVEQGDERI